MITFVLTEASDRSKATNNGSGKQLLTESNDVTMEKQATESSILDSGVKTSTSESRKEGTGLYFCNL